MRFKLHLRPNTSRPQLMWNYHYPLSAWLYSVIAKADENYSDFLHNQGYKSANGKTFKHFTFSDLRFKIGKQFTNGFEILSPTVEWTVSFLIDRTAESFIIGLFQDQQVHLFDKNFDTIFTIERIETLPELGILPCTKLRATSAMVIAEKHQGLDQYLEPTDENFGKYLVDGLIDKYLSVMIERKQAIDPLINSQVVDFKLIESAKMKSRKITIKDGKKSATEIKGYRNFEFELTAPKEMIEVGLFGGFGRHCAEGFGFCEVVG
jgi:CRISPR-associated endoribonuclease Cas6